MDQVEVRDSDYGSGDSDGRLFNRQAIFESVLLFLGAMALLFLFSSRIVGIFDEGILLTDVMRTMAGQVLHRDFYYNYGPAQLYVLAGLFKLFGPSVLVDRLTAVFCNSVLIVSLYILARRYCDRGLAFGAAFAGVLWIIGLKMTITAMNALLCTFTFWISWLILPVADQRLQRRRALGAGFLAGVTFLYRYDIGVSIVMASMVAVVIIMWQQEPGSWSVLRRLAATVMGPYIAAFAVTVAPFAVVYLSVAPLHDLLYDVVIYMAKYYRAGRALPFPIPRLGPTFSELVVYLVPIIIALGFWTAAAPIRAKLKKAAGKSAVRTPDWMNLLLTVSVAAAVTCAKGLVRVDAGGMYGSVIACLLTVALLLRHRTLLGIWSKGLLTVTATLFVLTAISSAQVQVSDGIHLKPLAINWILTPKRQPPSPAFRSWCGEGTPITRGFCFLMDDDRIETVRYLDAHTQPGDSLYVGLDHHDRIIANDMLTYFAAQRLPAVKWAEFDPFLENRADIQQEMIGELEQHKPPYAVLDSEFDNVREPNGSSVSTGVHLLDDYIAAHYKRVQQYGPLTIVQRYR
jgi:4-amino-4-deoxy-L-arabinose transferase-like glycosyltransferase